MSRIGKLPVVLPAGVTARIEGGLIRVVGPKGELTQRLLEGIGLDVDGDSVTITRSDDSRGQRAFHGLSRALFANMVKGVSQGFQRRLEIQGVGYKADLQEHTLLLTVGYSQPVAFAIPPDITIRMEGGTKIVVEGIDKQKVGLAAARLRAVRPPDHYKGKGIRYEGETVRIKAGKSAA
ncbi:MAG: 50S ribosomal protein L6 [Deltaproteobacteria bacterium]|nr:50S ribosomal protein L6 [Deltaproteobacteria bacterium]